MATDEDSISPFLRRPPRTREQAEAEAARLRIVNKINAYIRCRDQLRQLEAELDRMIQLGKGGAR